MPCYAVPDDILAVELLNDDLACGRMNKGDHAVIYLPSKPDNGHAGAVRAFGTVFIGFIFYGQCRDMFIVTPGRASSARHFLAGEYEVVGALKRICKAGDHRRCFSVGGYSASDLIPRIRLAR